MCGPLPSSLSGPETASSPLGTRRGPIRRGSTTVISGWYPSVTRAPGRNSSAIGPGCAGRGGLQQVAGAIPLLSSAASVISKTGGSVSPWTWAESSGHSPKAGRSVQRSSSRTLGTVTYEPPPLPWGSSVRRPLPSGKSSTVMRGHASSDSAISGPV